MLLIERIELLRGVVAKKVVEKYDYDDEYAAGQQDAYFEVSQYLEMLIDMYNKECEAMT